MPAYCDVCGNSGSWFWSNYENWWNPKIYCSFTCSAAGSWGLNLFAGFLMLLWTLTGGPLVFFKFIFSIFFFVIAYFGNKHADQSRYRRRTSVRQRYQNERLQDDIDEYNRMVDN